MKNGGGHRRNGGSFQADAPTVQQVLWLVQDYVSTERVHGPP